MRVSGSSSRSRETLEAAVAEGLNTDSKGPLSARSCVCGPLPLMCRTRRSVFLCTKFTPGSLLLPYYNFSFPWFLYIFISFKITLHVYLCSCLNPLWMIIFNIYIHYPGLSGFHSQCFCYNCLDPLRALHLDHLQRCRVPFSSLKVWGERLGRMPRDCAHSSVGCDPASPPYLCLSTAETASLPEPPRSRGPASYDMSSFLPQVPPGRWHP